MEKEIQIDGITLSVSENGIISRNGHAYKPQIDTAGYQSIWIAGKHYLVHRIIAMTFLEKYSEEIQVHHLNGDKADNRACNLKCMTTAEHQKLHKQIYPLMKKCAICGLYFTPSPTKRKRNIVCSDKCKKILDKRNAEFRKRKIAQYYLSGELVRVWDSARDVQNETGFFESNINKCCNNVIHSYKGFIWRYAENDTK